MKALLSFKYVLIYAQVYYNYSTFTNGSRILLQSALFTT